MKIEVERWTVLRRRPSRQDEVLKRVPRADDRRIVPSQTARERSRNIIRSPEVRDPLQTSPGPRRLAPERPGARRSALSLGLDRRFRMG